MIQMGKRIVEDTPRYAAAYTGNALSCTNCHIDDGKQPWAAPFVGLSGVFPTYLKRDKKVVTLADRINGCFERSMNGRPMPVDSKDMTALVSYISWLSIGVPQGHPVEGRGFVKLPILKGNATRGRTVYAASCAKCHGADGQGIYNRDGATKFPPLWGPRSFNDGAGMHKVSVAARFIQHNMPFDHPGILTPQEAYDVAAYIDAQPRPHFVKPSSAR